MRILVVEDDATTCARMVAMGKLLGWHVTACDDGLMARNVLKGNEHGERFDAVITDFQMPGCNGAELIEWMRSEPAWEQTPILLVSGLVEADAVKDVLNHQQVTFVAKPLDPLRTRDLLVSMLPKRRSTEEFRQTATPPEATR